MKSASVCFKTVSHLFCAKATVCTSMTVFNANTTADSADVAQVLSNNRCYVWQFTDTGVARGAKGTMPPTNF